MYTLVVNPMHVTIGSRDSQGALRINSQDEAAALMTSNMKMLATLDPHEQTGAPTASNAVMSQLSINIQSETACDTSTKWLVSSLAQLLEHSALNGTLRPSHNERLHGFRFRLCMVLAGLLWDRPWEAIWDTVPVEGMTVT